MQVIATLAITPPEIVAFNGNSYIRTKVFKFVILAFCTHLSRENSDDGRVWQIRGLLGEKLSEISMPISYSSYLKNVILG